MSRHPSRPTAAPRPALLLIALAAVPTPRPADARPPRAPAAAHAPHLPPCGERRRNCVGSEERDARRLPPIPYLGDRAATEARLRAVLAALPRTRLVAVEGDRWRVECTSRLLRFVDDVAFRFDDAARVVHFRSASRVGEHDLGVNRARMTRIAAAMRPPG